MKKLSIHPCSRQREDLLLHVSVADHLTADRNKYLSIFVHLLEGGSIKANLGLQLPHLSSHAESAVRTEDSE